MLLSRFWYVILSFALAAAVGVAFVAQSYHNRTTQRWMTEALAADSSAVGWYLKDDSRNRAVALLPVALSPDLREGLAKASEADEVTNEQRAKVRGALRKALDEVPPELKFTAVWAVDADGRVIGDHGWEHKADWNIGGFSVVADALAGWIRDDAWVLKEKLYRVVARPVERDGGGEPVGAIVALAAVDDAFADSVSKRTGAAVAFYALGTRIATGAPADFPKSQLDVIQTDLKEVAADEDYTEKGRSKVRKPLDDLGLVYARMRGEAWDLGSGYAVGRVSQTFSNPYGFVEKAEQQDTDAAPRVILGLVAFGLGLLGILFSVFEHTMPLRTFKREALRFAKGETDQLAPSRFRGLYKKIAADINDGVEKAAAKGGVPRRAADLEQVIGPLPAQPQMSAFAVPDTGPASAPTEKSLPKPPEKKLPAPPPRASAGGAPAPAPSSEGDAPVKRPPPAPPKPPSKAAAEVEPEPPSAPASTEAPVSGAVLSPADELAEWKKVYEEFVQMKRKCGESTEGLTFEKFKGTLERNKAALVSRHACSFVKFSVYEKDGKAALKASPVK
jgi:hypothetical protein